MNAACEAMRLLTVRKPCMLQRPADMMLSGTYPMQSSSKTHPERSLHCIPLLHIRNKARPCRLYWGHVRVKPEELI